MFVCVGVGVSVACSCACGFCSIFPYACLFFYVSMNCLSLLMYECTYFRSGVCVCVGMLVCVCAFDGICSCVCVSVCVNMLFVFVVLCV